jgi:release factor glutamine methyltransferase
VSGTAQALLAGAVTALRSAGADRPERDARILLQHAMATDHAGLIVALPELVDRAAVERFDAMIARRCRREPVWRIVGRREFFGLDLMLSPDVLDPRPETELLVECVLRDHEADKPYLFADVGTGSGAIAVALLRQMRRARCISIDISAAALEIAVLNAQSLRVAERMAPYRSDFLSGIDQRFDFIVSNPPYVETAAIKRLAPEVRNYDPHLALDGGDDGLDAYRAILAQSGSRLVNGGRLYLEFGAGQCFSLQQLAAAANWQETAIFPDLNGIDRVMRATQGREVAQQCDFRY